MNPASFVLALLCGCISGAAIGCAFEKISPPGDGNRYFPTFLSGLAGAAIGGVWTWTCGAFVVANGVQHIPIAIAALVVSPVFLLATFLIATIWYHVMLASYTIVSIAAERAQAEIDNLRNNK